MSDQASDAANQGQEHLSAADQSAAPALGVRAQYIKDLSFENPHAPASLVQGEQPRIDVNVNVEAKPSADLGFEVTLQIRADARINDRAAFVLELEYAGLFDLARIPEENRHAVCLIDAPRLLFPFARQIAAEATRSGGFPPMYLDPIDFSALYRGHMSQRTADARGTESGVTAAAETSDKASDASD